MTLDRLRELSQYLPPGPWRARREHDAIVLYDDDGPDAEPLALIYAGADLAHYLEACSPATLFADEQQP